MTFYAWAYQEPSRFILDSVFGGRKYEPLHSAAYGLIRSTSQKMQLAAVPDKLYIIPDCGFDHGREEWKKTREQLLQDMQFKHKIDAFVCANSAISGLVQMSDLLTGAAAAELNEEFTSKHKRQFHRHVVDRMDDTFFSETNLPVVPHGSFKIDCKSFKDEFEAYRDF
jgi:hypothetical protein